MKIKRILFESLIKEFNRPEISIILGPRQVPDTRGAVVFSRNLEDETSYLGKKILFRKLDSVHSLEIF